MGADIVVLDLAQDLYLCLPDASAAIEVRSGRIMVEPDWLGPLTDAGLVTTGPPARHRRLPPPARSELAPAAGPFSPADRLAFLRAAIAAVRIGPVVRIDTLAAALPVSACAPGDPGRTARLVALFQAWLPWVPRQGACLWRAFLLLTLLRHAGQNATWVFGVRTWPFTAHCWLQIGDAVLDDDPERVGLYTPIMAL